MRAPVLATLPPRAPGQLTDVQPGRNFPTSVMHLNDGAGVFNELWPWADPAADIRSHSLDHDLVDFDGDFDIDVFMSSRNSQARVFLNNLYDPVSASPFHDITLTALIDTGATQVGSSNYEGEYGDLDVFLANWSGTNFLFLSGLSQGLDPDVDGLFHRAGAGLNDLATWPELPSTGNSGITLDADCADTVIHAQIRDNVSYYTTNFYATELKYSVNGGATVTVPMAAQGSMQFRGVIPDCAGSIAYQVECTDLAGNTGVRRAMTAGSALRSAVSV